MASPAEALKEYGITLKILDEMKNLDALILAVPHESYKLLSPKALYQFFKPEARPNGSSPERKFPKWMFGFGVGSKRFLASGRNAESRN